MTVLLLLLACADEAHPRVDADGDGVGARHDCDDADPAVGKSQAYWFDLDGDGYGGGAGIQSCTPLMGAVTVGGDCDDGNPSVSPGAVELCDGYDDDCDGKADGGDAIGASAWFADGDQDGYGDGDRQLLGCRQPRGFVGVAGDCDDRDARVHPHAIEECDDGVDADCDGWDTSCWNGGDVSLADAAAVVAPVQSYSLAGATVRGVGDLDGDGYDDVAVGAPSWDAPGLFREDQGGVFVVDGPLSGKIDLATAGTFTVDIPSAQFGTALAGGRDLDGDGRPDVAIAAPYAADGEGGFGLVFVGHSPSSLTILPASGAAVRTQATVLAAGELDGDDQADLATGLAGNVRVWDGPFDGDAPRLASDVEVTGAAGFATCLDAGDLDGDGVDELIVGTTSHPEAAWILPGPLPTGAVAADDVGLRLSGPKGTYAGYHAAIAGDVDGDGLPEVVVGGPYARMGAVYAGAAWVLTGPFPKGRDLADHTALLVGENSGDHAGMDVAGVGDLDGDGLADVAVGAPDAANGNRYDSGVVYVVRGPVEGTIGLEASDLILRGPVSYSRAGLSIAAAGDYDGDGLGDLVVGAPGATLTKTASQAGAAFLVRGAAD